MGQDYGGHKAIAKAIKAKGLQKLKYYCQMCEKQCRDANGFKCHIQSESHLRQMSIFRENSGKFIANYSSQFKRDFVDLLRTRYCNQRVMANKVYNEYIADKNHVHMNATCWSTLGAFVKMLGKEGIVQVDEEPSSSGDSNNSIWYIRYIKRDENKMRREDARKKKEADEIDAEKTTLLLLEKQRKQQLKLQSKSDTVEPAMNTAQSSTIPSAPVNFSIKKMEASKNVADYDLDQETIFDSFENLADTEIDAESTSNKRKRSNMEQIIEEEERKKATSDEPPSKKMKEQQQTTTVSTSSWLHKNIVVKVLHKTLGEGKYYKEKGVIRSVEGTTATIEMLKSGDVLLLDQQFLETVIPQIGHKVRILQGEYAGKRATLEHVDFEKFCASLKLKDGTIVNNVPYEHFSKHYSKRK
jgi:DNA/RNA-binding protein KIN17